MFIGWLLIMRWRLFLFNGPKLRYTDLLTGSDVLTRSGFLARLRIFTRFRVLATTSTSFLATTSTFFW